MKATIISAAVLAAATVVSSGAFAQARGSYLRSCTDVRQRGPVLEAVCENRYGEMRGTRLDLSQCGRGDIANRNGRLVCSGGRGDREEGYEPGPRRGGYDRRW